MKIVKVFVSLAVLSLFCLILDQVAAQPSGSLYCRFDETATCDNGIEPLIAQNPVYEQSPFNQAISNYPEGTLTYSTIGILTPAEGTIQFLAKNKFPLVSEAGNTHVLFQLYYDQNSRLNFILRNDNRFELTINDQTFLSEEYSWSTGEYHFFTITYGSKGARLFIDGNLILSIKEANQGLSQLPDRFYLGSRFDSTFQANFYFDELKVLPYEKTHNQVALAMKEIHHSKYVGGLIEVSPQVIEAGKWGTLEIRYTTDRMIPPRGGIKFVAKHYNDWPTWQNSNPQGDNYVSASAEGKSITLRCQKGWPATAKYCEVKPSGESLPAETTVHLILGNTSQGSRGMRFPRRAMEKTPINILVDDGNRYYFETQQPAFVNIKAGPPVALIARGRSQVEINEEYKLNVWVEDQVHEINKEFTGTVTLSCDDTTATLPPPHTYTPEDKGKFFFTGIYFSTPGIKTIRVTATGLPEAISNPIEVMENYPERGQIFWGDLHGHTELSDGNGDLDSYFEFARDYAALDFAAISDHNPQPGSDNIHPHFWRNYVDEQDWQLTKNVVSNFHQPGKFISIIGQEGTYGNITKLMDCVNNAGCSGATSNPKDPVTGQPNWGQNPTTWQCYQRPNCVDLVCPEVQGDWHVYYNNSDPPLFTPDTVEELLQQINSWKTAQVASGNQFPAFIMTSHGGRLSLMDLLDHPAVQTDPDLVPVTEIISYHISSPCSFETWVQRGLTKTKLGIVASSDDHTSSPGYSSMNSGQGYIAVYAKELTREAIFEAITKRRVYAHSHSDRVILDFSINTGTENVFMGTETDVYGNDKPEVNFKAISQTGVKRIDLIKNGQVIASSEKNSQGVVEESFSYIDNDFSGEAYYYIKVVHQNWGTSWTSPIWLKPTAGYPRGDVNRDWLVNSQDIRLSFQYYSQTSWPEEIFPDVNSDAVVNALDIGEIIKNWQQSPLSFSFFAKKKQITN